MSRPRRGQPMCPTSFLYLRAKSHPENTDWLLNPIYQEPSWRVLNTTITDAGIHLCSVGPIQSIKGYCELFKSASTNKLSVSSVPFLSSDWMRGQHETHQDRIASSNVGPQADPSIEVREGGTVRRQAGFKVMECPTCITKNRVYPHKTKGFPERFRFECDACGHDAYCNGGCLLTKSVLLSIDPAAFDERFTVLGSGIDY